MRVSIKFWKWKLLLATNDDIEEAESVEWVQLQGGDFTPAPVEEEYYEEEEEEEWIPSELTVAPPAAKPSSSFGFTTSHKPNML
jgi:hypothetical protein